MIAFYDRGADERICGHGKDRVVVDRLIPEACGTLKPRAEEQKALARSRARR